MQTWQREIHRVTIKELKLHDESFLLPPFKPQVTHQDSGFGAKCLVLKS